MQTFQQKNSKFQGYNNESCYDIFWQFEDLLDIGYFYWIHSSCILLLRRCDVLDNRNEIMTTEEL